MMSEESLLRFDQGGHQTFCHVPRGLGTHREGKLANTGSPRKWPLILCVPVRLHDCGYIVLCSYYCHFC